MHLRLESSSPQIRFYGTYFIRCEHKLPYISLFSETCDFYQILLSMIPCLDEPLLLTAFLSLNLTNVTVSRPTPGGTQTTFPELPVGFDKELTPTTLSLGKAQCLV